MAMEGAFEARLGVGEKSDRSTSSAEITEEIEVGRGGGGGGGHDDVVLVVIDVNEKLSLIAFNWALVHVVQRGDTVRLLGVLHHIVNPSTSLTSIPLKSSDFDSKSHYPPPW